MIEDAIRYAERGWKVFPLKQNEKIPATPHGFKDATDDIGQIKKWWETNPDYNIGVATGFFSSITVIDLDGQEAMSALEKNGIKDKPETLIHKTRKGYHFILMYDPVYPQGAGFLEKLDIRNEGGYIVAPPSVVDNFTYSVYKDRKVSTWDSLSHFFRDYGSQDNRRGVSKVQDNPNTPSWVSEYLSNGVDEGQRNDAGIRLAGYFRKKQHPKDVATAMMIQFGEKCSPPMEERELSSIVESAWRYQITDTSYQGQGLENPIIDVNIANKRVFRWVDENISIDASRINVRHDGIHCWIRVGADGNPNFYGPVRINLLSSSARTGLIRQLKERQEKNWLVAIDQVAKLVADSIDPPDALLDMRDYKPVSQTPWLMKPFARVKQPSLIMGMGGEGKSTLGIAILLSAALGRAIVPGAWVEKPTAVMMLDWEANADEFYFVKNSLLSGSNSQEPGHAVMYRKMAGSLTDHLDAIQRDISEHDIGLILVDSIVASAGMDVNDADAARVYFEAMNMLDVSSIGITHTTKAGNDDTPFGSVFYWNLARNIWQVKKEQEQGSNHSVLGVYHKKGNRTGGLLHPIGMRADFHLDEMGNTTSIAYSPADLSEYETLVKGLSTKQQILALLDDGTYMNHGELAERTGIRLGTIRVSIKRMSDEGILVKNDAGQYGVTRNVTPVTENNYATSHPPYRGVVDDVTPVTKRVTDLSDWNEE